MYLMFAYNMQKYFLTDFSKTKVTLFAFEQGKKTPVKSRHELHFSLSALLRGERQ